MADHGRHLTRAKARKILHDKEVRGHPLTKKQRGFFGAVASGTSRAMRGLDHATKKRS